MNLDRQIEKLNGTLDAIIRKDVARSVSRALNRTATKVQSETVKSASAETGIAQKYLRPRVYIQKATIYEPIAYLRVYRKAINAINLNPTPQARGFKVAKKQEKRTFIAAHHKSMKIFLWQRDEITTRKFRLPQNRKGRSYPIRPVKVKVFDALTRNVLAIRDQQMATTYPKRLDHELEQSLKAYG
jgi:hypothetical protein